VVVTDTTIDTTEQQTVMVIGGYGKVGRLIVRELIQTGYQMIIAGRDLEKARQYAAEFQQAEGIAFDATEDIATSFQSVEQPIDAVIVAVELNSYQLARYCLQNAICYLDLTPSLSRIKTIKELEVSSDAIGLVSIGLSPGLTNLLIKQLQEEGNITRVEMHLELGYGETTGYNSFLWSFSNLNANCTYYEEGKLQNSTCFAENKQYQFLSRNTPRRVYRFNFPEQITLRETLQIPSLSYWLCYESAINTNILARMRWIFRSKRIQNIMARYYSWRADGIDTFRFSVAYTLEDQTKQIEINGLDQGRMTALIVARATKILLNRRDQYPAGVYHIEELMTLEDFQPIMNELEILRQELHLP